MESSKTKRQVVPVEHNLTRAQAEDVKISLLTFSKRIQKLAELRPTKYCLLFKHHLLALCEDSTSIHSGSVHQVTSRYSRAQYRKDGVGFGEMELGSYPYKSDFL